MTAVRGCLVAAVLVTGFCTAPAASADAPPVQRTTSAWTSVEDEVACGGELVAVTYDGTITTMTVRDGSWLRVRTAMRWSQGGVAYEGHANAGFAAPPSGRATTYRFQASAVGDDGSRVHVHEVVHALWSGGQPVVRVEFERVDCR